MPIYTSRTIPSGCEPWGLVSMISLDLSVEAKGWRRSKLVDLAYSGNGNRAEIAGISITDYMIEVDRVDDLVNK